MDVSSEMTTIVDDYLKQKMGFQDCKLFISTGAPLPLYIDEFFNKMDFKSKFAKVSDEIKSTAIDFVASRYEGVTQALSVSEQRGDLSSQSGTMKVLPFLTMIKAMVAGGVVEHMTQHWADAGCGAGIILLYLMAHCDVYKLPASFFGFDMAKPQVEKAEKLLIKYQTIFKTKFETNVIQAKFPEGMREISPFSKPNSIWFVNNFSWLHSTKNQVVEYAEDFKEEFVKLLGLRNLDTAGNVSVLILDPTLLDTKLSSQLQCFHEFQEVATFKRPLLHKYESVLLFCCRRATQKRLQDLISNSLHNQWTSPGTVHFFDSLVANLSPATKQLATMTSMNTENVAISFQQYVVQQGHRTLTQFLNASAQSYSVGQLLLIVLNDFIPSLISAFGSVCIKSFKDQQKKFLNAFDNFSESDWKHFESMFDTQPPLCSNFSKGAKPQFQIDSLGMLVPSFEHIKELNDWFERYSKNIMQCKVLSKEMSQQKVTTLQQLKFSNTLNVEHELIVTIWQKILVDPSLKKWFEGELVRAGSKARIAAALDIRDIAHKIKNLAMTDILECLPKTTISHLETRMRKVPASKRFGSPAPVPVELGVADWQPQNIGLQNLGQSCYMNATLQCLLHTTELSIVFLGGVYDGQVSNESNLLLQAATIHFKF
jgi:hypothetical protein